MLHFKFSQIERLTMQSTISILFFLLVDRSHACQLVRPLHLSEALLRALRPLDRVSSVPNTRSCVQLCLQEKFCSAAHYRSPAKACDLLPGPVLTWEGATEIHGPIEVWPMPGRSFGHCPASYNMTWKASRYLFVNHKTSWSLAAEGCRRTGGKLAELTSAEEQRAVTAKVTAIKPQPFVHLGGRQQAGVTMSTFEGWRWERSHLEVEQTKHMKWRQVKNPSNRWKWLAGDFSSGKLTLTQVTSSPDFLVNYLCECLSLM